MYRGYKTDEWFGDYTSNLSKHRIFSNEFREKPIDEVINMYNANLYETLGKSINSALSLARQIDNKDNKASHYDVVINIPSFYKEQGLNTVIGEIKEQVEQNFEKSFLLYIYNNGYMFGPNTPLAVKKSEDDIVSLLNHNKVRNLHHIVLSNVYPMRPSLSRIRSDMLNSLLLSNVSRKINEDTIYRPLDADLRKIGAGYLKELIKQHTIGYKIVIGGRNWSFEEEKNEDPFLYLQEKMFLLGEDSIYNKSDDNEISTLTNGWSSSFNMKSLLLVKGYERDFDATDDLIIGHKLNRFYGKDKKQKNIASFMDKEIRSDGSRGSDALCRGDYLFEQWDREKYHVKQSRNNKANDYKRENDLMFSLLSGDLVTEGDKVLLESMFSAYIRYFSGKNQNLNKIYKERLVALLQDFFGEGCMYSFSLLEAEQKVKIAL